MTMFRQAAMVPRLASHTTLRIYGAQTRFARYAVSYSLVRAASLRTVGRTPLSLPASSHSMATASFFTSAPRRWCSSNAGTKEHTEAASTNTRSASAAEGKATSLSSANLCAAESSTPAPSVAAQISALSEEDQTRILSALQHPEKEKSSVMGGAGIGPAAGDMVAAFTCGPCDYRMVKRFSKHAYTRGIVIVECPNCGAKHLLADNLGWLEDEARNIEDILREKGDHFIRINGTSGDYEAVANDEAAAVSAGVSSTTTQE